MPNKQDAIDVKLGQFVNNYPDKRKLKFAFVRQAQGKYVFGTRLVTVKVEGSSIHVVTDGTSMPIGQFIDEITPKEVQKYESRDPMKLLMNRRRDVSRDPSQAGGGLGDTLTIDHSTLGAGQHSKSMKRLDSKATSLRTSTTKSPLKKRTK